MSSITNSIKPIEEIVSNGGYKRFPLLFKCKCPKCNVVLKRNSDSCPNCGQLIDWSEWDR